MAKRPTLTLDSDTTGPGIVAAMSRTSGSTEVPIEDVYTNPSNPESRILPSESLENMAESFQEIGIIHPLVVVTTADGHMVLAGNRRLAAARLAGLPTVPVIVRNDLRGRTDEVMLAENGARLDLTPLEEATAYQRLIDAGVSQVKIARSAGRSQAHVSQRLTLLTLPQEVQELIKEDHVSAWDAYQQRNTDPVILKEVAQGLRKATSGPSFVEQVTVARQAKSSESTPPPAEKRKEGPKSEPAKASIESMRGTFLVKLMNTDPTVEDWDLFMSMFVCAGLSIAEVQHWSKNTAWCEGLTLAEEMVKTPISSLSPVRASLLLFYYEQLQAVGYKPFKEEQVVIKQWTICATAPSHADKEMNS
ncbi:MAG: ParB/RepB/Spo0J family partition protein [Propionibacteriaceae bacterium]|nr:ParB/RepB/Spo0J family partition protein [Propionibacteriaceae bacterium]